jgi:biofilm protein TabA
MVLDRLTCWRRFQSLHAGFVDAFRALSDPEIASLPAGRHSINGERLYLIVGRDTGRGRHRARLESHRRYIDIQLTLAGQEEIGWLPLADCLASLATTQPLAASHGDEPYDGGRDIAFYSARPETWLALPPGTFAIFFPEDAHAPLAGQDEIVKVVAKVALDW